MFEAFEHYECDGQIDMDEYMKGKEMEKNGAIDLIREVANDICLTFCKYSDTTDEDCKCEWVRQGNECPLDRLN